MFHVPEHARLRVHPILASSEKDGNNGAFIIHQTNGRDLWVIASDEKYWKDVGMPGDPWEHVSVHAYKDGKAYLPTWLEMCKVKDLFWDEEDVVVQFHPKKSEYINQHPTTLHMWRPIGIQLPTPPKEAVGNKL